MEAMFPGYLFARFTYPLLHRRVEHSPGIRGIVHFGDYLATLDPQTMAALQEKTGEDDEGWNETRDHDTHSSLVVPAKAGTTRRNGTT